MIAIAALAAGSIFLIFKLRQRRQREAKQRLEEKKEKKSTETNKEKTVDDLLAELKIKFSEMNPDGDFKEFVISTCVEKVEAEKEKSAPSPKIEKKESMPKKKSRASPKKKTKIQLVE